MASFNYTDVSRKATYRYPLLTSLGIHLTFWVLAYTLYIVIRHLMMRSVSLITDFPLPLDLPLELMEGLGLSAFYALLLALINFQLDKVLPSLSFGLEIIIRSAIYFLTFLVIWSIGSAYFREVIVEDIVIPDQAVRYQFIALLTYTLVSTLLFGFIRQVNKTYGPGVLVPILLGYYRKPVREYRIFLFADLNSSTTYAEKLGMHDYSLLIQDCFQIANKILPYHDAQVYQYVGDEIVLIWQAYQQKDFLNALDYYFHFTEELRSRAEYFKEKYGVIPEFKAGINCGEITVVEVGKFKREIAYHGDNINIAARLESLCSDLARPILVTEGFRDQVRDGSRYEFEVVQEVQLKGKLKKTNVYSVSLR